VEVISIGVRGACLEITLRLNCMLQQKLKLTLTLEITSFILHKPAHDCTSRKIPQTSSETINITEGAVATTVPKTENESTPV